MGESGNARGGRRRVIVRSVSVLVGLVLLAPGAWLVYYRFTFHTFAWWQIPPRISYCGRDYDQGTTVASEPSRGFTLTQVMTIEPAGWPVYTLKPAAQTYAQVPGLPCTMGLVLKQSDHRFIKYGLDGGP
jgi:hypothetical protein